MSRENKREPVWWDPVDGDSHHSHHQSTYRLGIARRIKNIVKAFLQDTSLHERPGGVFLVTKEHVIQNGFGNSQKTGYLLVQFAALVRECHPLVGRFVVRAQGAVQLPKGRRGLFLGEFHTCAGMNE